MDLFFPIGNNGLSYNYFSVCLQVLIFSQFKGTLDLLEEFLNGRGFSFERIDGDVTGSRRQVSLCFIGVLSKHSLPWLSL